MQSPKKHPRAATKLAQVYVLQQIWITSRLL